MYTNNPFRNLTLNTLDDVDNACRTLSEQWERSFSPAPQFDGKKKSKLRDMVCHLAGYTNGFTSFMASITVPTIAQDAFDMPDELMATFDYDLNYLYIGSDVSRMKTRHGDPEMLNEASPDCIAVLYHDDEWRGEMKVDRPIFGMKDGEKLDVTKVDYWIYLCNYYTPTMIMNIQPRIDRYGVSTESTPLGMQTFMKDLGVMMEFHQTWDALQTIDRGDDGSESYAILWTKKASVTE